MKIKWAITSLLIICINIIHVFGEEKLMEYKQGNFEEGFFLRKTIGEDDFTKNYLVIDESGNLFNYQDDSRRFMKINADYETSTLFKLEELSRNPFIISKEKENIYVDSYYGGFKAFKNNEIFIKVSMREVLNIKNCGDGRFYYNKENDVLLALSTSGNSKNIYNACVVAKALGIKTIPKI